jgi:ABC-type polysaccharide/polyol phosphate export permease
MMLSTYRFRWLLYELVVRDLKLRYRGSVLGFAWTLLNPILFMCVYTLVFSVFMRTEIRNYPLFLLSGLIPWIWLSGAITQATTSILDGSAYIGKTLMPAQLLVLVPVLSNGVNFLITIALLLPVSLALGINIGWALVFLPLLVLVQFSLTLGLALLVATVNVFFRDLQQIVSYVLTAAFFLTPIFYSRSTIPANVQFVVQFNPVAGLIAVYQSLFYKGTFPDWNDLFAAGGFAVVSLFIGLAYFNSMRDALGETV